MTWDFNPKRQHGWKSWQISDSRALETFPFIWLKYNNFFFFVKQGFTQNHSALVPEEYGSLVSKADSSTAVVNSKVLSDLKSIMSKKEDLNTLADSGKDSGK